MQTTRGCKRAPAIARKPPLVISLYYISNHAIETEVLGLPALKTQIVMS